MDIIIKTNTPEELIATATTFFQAKKKVEQELLKLDRIEQFYKKELNELRNQYHTTKDGKVLHLSQMENSHLMNTAALMEGKFGRRGVVNKYTNEIKKRGLVNEYFALLDSKNILVADEPDEEEDIWEDGF